MRRYLLRQIEGLKTKLLSLQTICILSAFNYYDWLGSPINERHLFDYKWVQGIERQFRYKTKRKSQKGVWNDKRPWFIIWKAHNNWTSILNGPLHSFNNNKWKKQFNNKCSMFIRIPFPISSPVFLHFLSSLFSTLLPLGPPNRFVEWNVYKKCIVVKQQPRIKLFRLYGRTAIQQM